ncbi:uncharacterized protein LOC129775610 [Toxorhynchites rutilus septentrionalis]|uniref:uncharacterized protein LOC129775610 n=1 Tax=Toxorhynchites rutilus septentrionalis TaxID=329112 RepID=UPI002478F42D|nr:uncharacterized protein LOC129775610 [Toxorhynchites rutilus septentrionalis]
MVVFKVLLVISTIAIAGSEPFFGNDVSIPQSAWLNRDALCVANSLVSARNALSSYVRSPPVNSVSLKEGATCLALYISNVTKLEGDIYLELGRAVNDRTTNPAIICSKLNKLVADLKPLLANSTTYITCIKENFDTSYDNYTHVYYKEWNEQFVSDALELELTLKNICLAIDSLQGKLIPQQFVAELSKNGTLQKLEAVASRRCPQATDLSIVASLQYTAINLANNFRSTFNSRLQTNRLSARTTVNSYIANSNTSLNSITAAVERFAKHVATMDDAFFFRWPQVPSEPVMSKRILLNQSIEAMTRRITTQKRFVEDYYLQMSTLFGDINPPQTYLEHEAELVTRTLMSWSKSDTCVLNFRNRLIDLPAQVHTQLSRCVNNQVTLERNGANQVVSIVGNVLQPHVTIVYANGEICFSYPFSAMSRCLDAFVHKIDFTPQFQVVDFGMFNLFIKTEPELLLCNERLMNFVQNLGLGANCFSKV